MHTEVLAASAGLDVARVLALQPLHEASGQLPAQERVLPVGLLAKRQAGHHGGPQPHSPAAIASQSAVVLCGQSLAQGHSLPHGGTWFLPHRGCLMMLRTGLKQLSPVWSP